MRKPGEPTSPRAAAAAAIAVAALLATAGCGDHRRPDVIVIVMDTTRADHCGWLGYPRPTTPRLDEFSKECAVFEQAWAPEGWTGPCHASLFTGLSVEHHGFYTGARVDLAPVVPTLAELLQRGGYATGCFTNNEWISEAFGLTRGFQRIDPLYENEKRPYPYAPATHEVAATWAEEQHAAGKQFFLFINDMEPHLPYTPLPADAAKFVRGSPSAAEMAAARDLKHPETTQYCAGLIEFSDDKLQLLTDLYDAEVATLDREIGRLLDRLRAKGILDSAIVVIAGDHGEMLGEHHHVSHNHSLWSQARRVPLLVRLPGTFDGGRTVRDLVRLEDVMPTVLEACKVTAPDGLDGRSLARDLPGRVSRAHHAQDGKALAKMQAEFPGADMHRLADSIDAVSDGRWHYLEFGDGRRELYDVAADPAEKHNLAAEKPAEAAAMAALLRGGH